MLRRDFTAWRLPALVGVLYLAVALAVLSFGFPAEDAFILFRFAANVARGYGIVFSPGGPHAEGATDFLWMLSLAGARGLGVDVAVAAAILNALGCGACAWLFLRGGSARVSWLELLALGWLLCSPPAMAGYVGFGTMPFCALALWMALTCAEGSGRALACVPLAGVVLTLLRPDGGFLAVGFGVLAAVRLRNEPARVRTFVVAALVAGLVGASYFVWRVRYFTEPLPLPMYVKRHFSGHPGLWATLDWGASVLPTCMLLLGVVVLARGEGRFSRREAMLLLALLPFAVHVASFLPTTPSQNIANRFQAPATVALMCVAFRFLRARAELLLHVRPVSSAALVVAALVPGVLGVNTVLLEAVRPDYLESFAPELAAAGGPAARIATTEAGNIPYWTDAMVLDLVGLNSPETARFPPTRQMLEGFGPDIVMVHPAGGLDAACMKRMLPETAWNVARILGPLGPCVLPERASLVGRLSSPYRETHVENVVVAPVVAFDFLDAHREAYDVYVVRARTNGGMHVYGLRRSWDAAAAMVVSLDACHRTRGASYLRVLRGPSHVSVGIAGASGSASLERIGRACARLAGKSASCSGSANAAAKSSEVSARARRAANVSRKSAT
jgi:hypothetical protein